MTTFSRSLLVACDLRDHDAKAGAAQWLHQELLLRCLDRAASAVGLDRGSWSRRSIGDEEFAVLPADSRQDVVVDSFVRRVTTELHWINRDRDPGARVRLRMAAHLGDRSEDRDTVSALLSCAGARAALSGTPGADLLLVLSGTLFHALVSPGTTSLRPEDFRRVTAAGGDAWLRTSHSAAGGGTPVRHTASGRG